MIGSIGGTKTLGKLFEERVSLYKEKEFLVYEGSDGEIKRFSYIEFNELVNRLAHGLIKIGVAHGEKVVVHLSDSPEWVLSWFAITKIGAIIVPTNIHSTSDEIEYIINYSDATYIISEPKYLAIFSDALKRCQNIKNLIICKSDDKLKGNFLLMEKLIDDNKTNPNISVHPDDINEMLFTSGTTARPKGALLTHKGIVYQGIATGLQLWLSPSDRVLIVLPLFHVNGQMLTLVPAMTFGGTVIIIEEYSASKFMSQLRSHKATFTCIVPTILRTMLKQPLRDDDRIHSLRSSFFALPISEEEWNTFEERFNIKLIDGYGLTETYPLAMANPYWGLRKRHCIGLPAIGFEIKLINDEGSLIDNFQEPGEILIRGNPIFIGYYKNEEETKKAIDEDGWLHTGDIGYFDSDGYYYFFDRKKDIIKRAGENISASEVERVLNDHPYILESAVVSVPDKMRDEAVFAFIVINSDVSIGEVIEYCKSKMSKFKIPQYIKIIDNFEKTSVGKIKKNIYKKEALNIIAEYE